MAGGRPFQPWASRPHAKPWPGRAGHAPGPAAAPAPDWTQIEGVERGRRQPDHVDQRPHLEGLAREGEKGRPSTQREDARMPPATDVRVGIAQDVGCPLDRGRHTDHGQVKPFPKRGRRIDRADQTRSAGSRLHTWTSGAG